MLKNRFLFCGLATLASMSLGFLLACSETIGHQQLETAQAVQPNDRPIEVAQDDYVSSGQCRDCHADQYSSWHASHHRTMTQVPSADTVIADFDDHRLTREGREFRFFKRDDGYFMAMKKLSTPEQTESPESKEFRIVLVTGAHHQQAYWYATDQARTLGKIPFIWITAENRWVPYGSIFFLPPSGLSMHAGVWNSNCIKCHVVSGRPRYQSQAGYDTHVAELGISCEACHGPGQRHVALHRSGASVDRDQDPIVVNPANLSHVKSSQTCGQCHSVFEPLGRHGITEFNRSGYPFRPGDDLFDSRHVFRVGEDPEIPVVKKKLAKNPEFYQRQYWSDGMVRVTGREYNGLLESPCYQRGKMSCISCHAMHPQLAGDQDSQNWANDQLLPNMRGSEACLQCHQEFADSKQLVAHTHHSADSTGSDCYNCHMPHTTLGLMKASRSHTIDSPNVARTLATGRPNACNLCHLNETLDWTAQHLKTWYQIPKPELEEDHRTIASSVQWLLKGDAGQRAIVGWHFGWPPAQEASGRLWMAPFVAELLEDSYEVVRFIGFHALKTLPGYDDFEYDYVGSADDRLQGHQKALEVWQQSNVKANVDPAILIDDDGRLIHESYRELRSQRTDPRIILVE